MPQIFMVAEKPSLAESIAKILSRNQQKSYKGFNGACSVHTWNGTFQNQNCRYKMTSVCGHVMTTDFPKKFNDWERVDPCALFLAPIEKKEANPKLKMVDFLKKEAAHSDTVILWLDCDKEGENICFEVLDSIESVCTPNFRVFRAHFSAVAEKDIFRAMENLRFPNKNEALSVDARQELDLRIGCAFTRFQTKYFQGKYGDLNTSLVSYGPCQTPTLGFCVERADKISSFKPEKFWRIKAQITYTDDFKRTREFNLDWKRGKLFSKDAVTGILASISSRKVAVVSDVSSESCYKSPPVGLNTVEMLKAASSGLKIGPHQCMSIAERLYTSGYINYPRTETTSYPDSFNFYNHVSMHTQHPQWGQIAQEILTDGIRMPRTGKDAGDHPPIVPMKMVPPSQLEGNARALYEYITMHFFASLMPKLHYKKNILTFKIGDELFEITSVSVIDKGFTKAMHWAGFDDDEEIPVALCKIGVQVPMTSNQLTLSEGQTSPPDYLTESELIGLMEQHGIGTDASIPVHIENIIQRGYVELVGNRKLMTTKLGVILVHGYKKIDPELVLPQMRNAIEKQLNQIAIGQSDYSQVVNYAIALFSAKYIYFAKNISLMDHLFEVSFSSLSSSGKPFCRCHKCRKYMVLIDMKPQRLHCPYCNQTYSLPQNGTVRQYKEEKCPLDNCEILLFTTGSKGKSFPFCLYCYSNPPFEGMRKNMGCDNCVHPTCKQSLASKAIDLCMDCHMTDVKPPGILRLDDTLPPKFRLICNRCDNIILFPDCVKSATRKAKESCEKCTAKLLNIKIDKSKCSIDTVDEEFSGCIFCDDNISKLLQNVKAKTVNPKAALRKKINLNTKLKGGLS